MNVKLHANATESDKDPQTRVKTPADQRDGDILKAMKLRHECVTFFGELKLSGIQVWGDHALFPDGSQCFAKVTTGPYVPLKLAKRGDQWGVLMPVMRQTKSEIHEEWFDTKEDMMDWVSEAIRLEEEWLQGRGV